MFERKITVIGLGEIGMQTFLEINKTYPAAGVDINAHILSDLCDAGYNVSDVPSRSDVYIICVYSTEQVMQVICSLDLSNEPLIVIESTILPGTAQKILEQHPGIKLVLFPHRYNPNDPEHHVFNLNRLLAATDPLTLYRAMQFYTRFMPEKLIHCVTLQIAEISKPMENAYRFLEIMIAQEIKRMCESKDIDFNALRSAMNTKWNINLKEARDGIGGKCLPKDVKLIDEYIGKPNIFSVARDLNNQYILNHNNRERDQ